MKKYFAEISLICTLIVMTFTAANLHWNSKNHLDITEVDSQGYYAYLPAIFIYQDLNFGFFEAIEGKNGKYYEPHNYFDYRNEFAGKKINKYFAGTAVAQVPFFLIAHFLTYLTGGETDGFSGLYLVSVTVAALFYLVIGLWFLNQLLQLYKISSFNRGVTLISVVFGTNLFCYAAAEPGMSHVYSFAFITAFSYYAKVLFSQPKRQNFLLLAALLGMIILIRPTNALIVCALPFLAGSFVALKAGLNALFSNVKTLTISTLLLLSIVSVQLIIYKISTGHFLVYAYSEEGFNFTNPHFFDILFSYRKGLFLYTPLYLLSLSGLCFIWKKSKWQVVSWFAFFTVITYIFSSWWMWYYGGSFSGRIYVEYLSLFMILLSISLENLTGKLWQKRSFLSLIFTLIILCQIQTYQYRLYKIHWSDMTKEMYWEVFLQLSL